MIKSREYYAFRRKILNLQAFCQERFLNALVRSNKVLIAQVKKVATGITLV